MTQVVTDSVGVVDRFQRRHRWTAVPYAVTKKFGDDAAGNLVALVAYFSFLSLFPLLLVFLTVLGFVLSSHPDLQRSVVDSALAQFPVVGDQLRSNVSTVRGSGIGLAIGLVVSLWAGLRAAQAMHDAMDAIWRVPIRKRSGFVAQKLTALAVLGLVGAAVVGSTGLSSFATATAEIGLVGRVGAAVLAVAFAVAMFLVIFEVLADHPRATWSTLWPGSLLAGVAWVVLQTVGTIYVQHVVNGSSETYGSFAVVLGLVAYLYLLAQISIYAAELNAVLALGLWPRAIDAEQLTRADRRALTINARVEERIPDQRVKVHLPPSDRGGEGQADGGARRAAGQAADHVER